MQHAPAFNHKVTFNRLEAWDADEGTGQAWEGSAWFGYDRGRLWLRSEGERADGEFESADLEVLYGRSVTPWWDVVAGVRTPPELLWLWFRLSGQAPQIRAGHYEIGRDVTPRELPVLRDEVPMHDTPHAAMPSLEQPEQNRRLDQWLIDLGRVMAGLERWRDCPKDSEAAA